MEPLPPQELAEIHAEAESARRLARESAAFLARDPGEPRARQLNGERLSPLAGHRLIAHCQELTRRRYRTLLHFERDFPASQDHGFLIVPACQILEAELERLLVTPARSIAASLVEALAKKKERRQAEILSAWAAGELPTTLGLASLVLLALRRGCERGVAGIEAFLAEHFSPRYLELLRSKELGRSLDRVRNEFRNPACHGLRTFSAADYAAFVRLLTAQERMRQWDRLGPPPRLDPAQGTLHHHLFETKQRPPAGDPIDRLLALRAPEGSPLALDVQLLDLQGAERSSFRLGEALCIAVRPSAPCHLALIDVGTSSAVACLVPNAWRAEGWCAPEPGLTFPGPDEPAIELCGGSGTEHLVAIGSSDSLSPELRPDSGDAFRLLDDVQLADLLDRMGRAAPERWTVTVRSFEVLPRG